MPHELPPIESLARGPRWHERNPIIDQASGRREHAGPDCQCAGCRNTKTAAISRAVRHGWTVCSMSTGRTELEHHSSPYTIAILWGGIVELIHDPHCTCPACLNEHAAREEKECDGWDANCQCADCVAARRGH